MSTPVILIEMAVFAALFTAIVFTAYRGDRKYSPAGISNYPPDIQAEYFKTHAPVEVSYRSKKVLLTKGFGVLLFIFRAAANGPIGSSGICMRRRAFLPRRLKRRLRSERGCRKCIRT